jgi:hypothetical protein
MKPLMIFTILLVFGITCGAQAPDDKALYVQKVEKYRKMKTTGQVLTFVGSAMFVTGFVMLINAAEESVNQTGQSTDSSGAAAGLAVYLIGVGGVSAGVPLWIVGGINKGRYERKLQAVSVRLNVSQQNTGLTINYKF